MSKKYYTELKTWVEGYVDIPWEWAKFEELPDYRLRGDFTVKASDQKVKNIFLSMNDNTCTKFLKEYVAALVIGVIIDLDNESEAITKLKQVFGYCEILGICEVTYENRDQIRNVMANANVTLTIATTP